MTKDKTKQLNKSLINYIDALDAINKNYVTLHNLNKDIEELKKGNRPVREIRRTNIPNKQIKRWVQR